MDGNHECYPYLADLPVTERWGGKVQVYPDYPHIIHLMRGQVYDLPTGDPRGSSARVFCMGGASSHDKQWRTPGISWWPEELPNHKEYHEAERNLEAAGWRVDFVVSHCCPGRLLPRALDAASRRGIRAEVRRPPRTLDRSVLWPLGMFFCRAQKDYEGNV